MERGAVRPQGESVMSSRRFVGPSLLVILSVALLGAPGFPQELDLGPTDPADPRLNQGPKATATGEHGMVSTQLASSTLAAVRVLEDGGNAVDAALTALFVQQVNDYHMVFLFGSMSALYYDAATERVYALNAIAARPLGSRVEQGDPMQVAIGGTVRGSEALAERFGSRPWASYFEPAIAAAEEGAIVTSFMYGLNFALFDFGFLGDLRDNEEARQFYMPDGHLVGAGQRWKMPALAETLRRVAEQGADYMYTGAWGQKFVQAATERGHGVSLEDMAAYRPEWSEPTRFVYRGHEVWGSPPPDYGGLEISANLNVLANFDLASMGHYSESVETLEVMARTFDRTSAEIGRAVRDPLSWKIPDRLLLSEEYGRLGAEWVRETMPRVDLSPAEKAGGGVGESSGGAAGSGGGGSGRGDLGSDHIVVVDRHGNWLSMLHTIHGGAPGVFVDGVRATGSEFGGRTVGEGRRLVLPISAIMLAQDGKPWLAMGTPGNPPQPVTEVLVNILDFGMEPAAAADAPRFWAFDENETIRIESRLAEGMKKGLATRGLSIIDLGDYNYHTGSMQIVWRDEQGMLHGSTDARRLGSTLGH